MYFPDLIDEYKQSLKDLKAAGGCPSMERDMLEAIKWMETGYDPAEYRAATRQDTFVMDHHLMEDLITYVDSEHTAPHIFATAMDNNTTMAVEINRLLKIKKIVNGALAGLTTNERVVFILVKAEYMTFAKVAKILGVTRGTVQNYLKRAERKIDKNIAKKKFFHY